MKTVDVGKKGERLAERYLRRKGYRILERNYRAGRHEIDIIAFDKKGNCIAFVEVKARSDSGFGLPCEAVGAQKQRFLRLAAETYLKRNADGDTAARFDIVEVYLKDNSIRHISNAF
ncbi:MAG: YraN family protein [Clostridia bacterium]|nr:YraN family protein [Clostridia bacterium]